MLANAINGVYVGFESLRELVPRPLAWLLGFELRVGLILGPIVALAGLWDAGIALFFVSAAGLAFWTGRGRERFQTEELSQEAERIAAAKQWYVEEGDAPDAEAELERRLMAALDEDEEAIAEIVVSALLHDRQEDLRLYVDDTLFPAAHGLDAEKMGAALHAASDALDDDDDE